MAKLFVSKTDAAKRQIEQAIVLLFDNGDFVSIHTLASAAWKIVRDICEGKNTDSAQRFKDLIVPGMESQFWAAMNRAANFFKHADNDPDGLLDVNEEANEYVLLMAIYGYEDSGHKLTKSMKGFVNWMCLMHPNLLKQDAHMRHLFMSPDVSWVRNANRLQQLACGKLLLNPPTDPLKLKAAIEAILDLGRPRHVIHIPKLVR